MNRIDPSSLARDILGEAGPVQRRALARGITLLESTREDHRLQADDLLAKLQAHAGNSLRVGISGVPGAGKSTIIEALGMQLVAQGHRVAVLAVDPSSALSGGSILGDKTRMAQLSVHERAFIRPSPSSGTLGGVAEKTRESMVLCEAAGHDVVIVETVGVGQSEAAVAGMVDVFVLLHLPNSGDELQAIKRGIMERADLIVVNKSDIDPQAAQRAQSQIQGSLSLFARSHEAATVDTDSVWRVPVLRISALHGEGLQAMWQQILDHAQQQKTSGRWQARRSQQAKAWMWERIDAGLKHLFKSHPQVLALWPEIEAKVLAGDMVPSSAARQLLSFFGGRLDH